MKKFNLDNNFNTLTKGEYQLDNMQAYAMIDDESIKIFSYNTIILKYDRKTKKLFENTTKFSNTTTKQQNKILTSLKYDFDFDAVVKFASRYNLQNVED